MKQRLTILSVALALSAGCEAGGGTHDDHSEHHDEGHAEHHDEGHNDHGEGHREEVHLTPEALKSARLTLEPAALGQLTGQIRATGRVALDPTRHAVVGAWIHGQVDRIQVRTGDPIRKGAPLASIYTPDLGAVVGEFRSAKAHHSAEQSRLERLTLLEAGGVSSRAQVLDAEAEVAEAQGALEAIEERLRVLGVEPSLGEPSQGEHYPAHVPVTSPIPGEVLQVLVSVGQQVDPGYDLFRVGDLDEVWLLADIYAADVSKVSKGQSLSFTVDGWPGEQFTGVVDQVGSWVDPGARTLELRALVPNPDHRLKPNMFAQVSIESADEVGERGIIVASQALVELEGEAHVFLQEGPGVFRAQAVKVGGRSGGRVCLRAGIKEGDLVVTQGAFTLKSELEKGELGGGHAH